MSQYPNMPPYASQAPYAPQAPPYHPGAPPPGFQPPPSSAPVHTTTIIQTSQYGETPKRMMCPNCRNEILTAVSSEYSIGQHIAFFIMCITGACCFCSCVPYCIDSLANVKHTCPHCQTHLGTFNRC